MPHQPSQPQRERAGDALFWMGSAVSTDRRAEEGRDSLNERGREHECSQPASKEGKGQATRACDVALLLSDVMLSLSLSLLVVAVGCCCCCRCHCHCCRRWSLVSCGVGRGVGCTHSLEGADPDWSACGNAAILMCWCALEPVVVCMAHRRIPAGTE